MARLTEQEKQDIVRYLEADKPLPDKFRFLLFEDKQEVELVWNGKSSEVSNIVLPFQVIEQANEPCAEKQEETIALFGIADIHDFHHRIPFYFNRLNKNQACHDR